MPCFPFAPFCVRFIRFIHPIRRFRQCAIQQADRRFHTAQSHHPLRPEPRFPCQASARGTDLRCQKSRRKGQRHAYADAVSSRPDRADLRRGQKPANCGLRRQWSEREIHAYGRQTRPRCSRAANGPGRHYRYPVCVQRRGERRRRERRRRHPLGHAQRSDPRTQTLVLDAGRNGRQPPLGSLLRRAE